MFLFVDFQQNKLSSLIINNLKRKGNKMNAKLPSRYSSFLTINRSCNLRCEWCYANPERFIGNKNMSLETVEKSINLFKGLPIKSVILIGGEPTIHPDFLTITKMIKEANLSPALITNGIKFKDAHFLQKTLDAGVNSISMSLKGGSTEEYKRSTGRWAFNDVMRGLKNIVESGVNNNLSVVISDDLCANFDMTMDAILNSGVKHFSIDTERPAILNNEAIYSGNFSFKQMATFIVEIYPKLEACGLDFTINISIPFCLFPDGFIEILKKKNRMTSGCPIYTGSAIVIDPSGKLLPCNHFCDNALGELGVDFSTANDYLKFRGREDIKEFYNVLSSYPDEKCKHCNYWQECGAGCRLNWLYKDSKELILT